MKVVPDVLEVDFVVSEVFAGPELFVLVEPYGRVPDVIAEREFVESPPAGSVLSDTGSGVASGFTGAGVTELPSVVVAAFVGESPVVEDGPPADGAADDSARSCARNFACCQ